MRTRFRTLLLAGAAVLAMSGAALAQTTVNGSPSTISAVMKIVCQDANVSAAAPCFVALSNGGSSVSASNPMPVADGTDGPGTNPGTGARGWLSGIYAKQVAAVAAGSTSPSAQPVQGAGAAGTPLTGGLLYNTTAPTLTNGQLGALQGDASANLKVNTVAAGGSTAANQTTEIAALNLANQRSVIAVEAATGSAIAANATLSGGTRDLGATLVSPYTRFTAKAQTSVAGTLYIQESNDNFASGALTASTSLAANAASTITVSTTARYVRALIINGGTAGTVQMFNTALTAN